MIAQLFLTTTMGTQQPHHDTVPFTATGEAHLGVLTGAELSPTLCRDESCAISPTDEEKKEETQRQAWFENAVKKKLNIPNSYVQVAPLIIRWASEIDDHDKGHTIEVIAFLFSRNLRSSFDY